MPAQESPHPEDLLTHLDFVRGLARGLVADGADDLVQDTYVTALQSELRRPAQVRGWLAIIVRNLTRNMRRSQSRRRWHEARVAAHGQEDPTVEVLEREELRQRVVRAVLDLREPYRKTVLQVYYHGLSCADVARAEGARPATVRSRLRRALSLLRERLDRDHGTSRAAWAVPLAPVAGIAHRAGVGARAVEGALVMKKTVLAAAAVVLASVTLLWSPWSTWGPPPSAVPPTLEARRVAPPEAEMRTGGNAAGRIAVPEPVIETAGIYPADRGLGGAHGILVDETGTPVAGVEVVLTPSTNALPPGMRLVDDRQTTHATRTDERGAFSFEAVLEGPWVASATHRSLQAEGVAVVVAQQTDEIVLRLAEKRRRQPLVVEVVDGTGAPVSGVPVRFVGLTQEACVGMGEEPAAERATDALGRVTFEEIRVESGVVVAEGPTGTRAWSPVNEAYRPIVRLTLRPPGAVHGRLLGLPPDELGATTVVVHALNGVHNVYGTAHGIELSADVRDGAYAFSDLAAGRYLLTVRSDRACLVLTPQKWDDRELPNSAEPKILTVKSGEDVTRDLRVQRSGTLRVSVCDRDGRPVRGAEVLATFGPTYGRGMPLELGGAPAWRLETPYYHPGARRHPLAQIEGSTSAAGECILTGLQPGRHRVEVRAAGLCYDRHNEIAVELGATARVEFTLERDGVLQGLLPEGVQCVGLRRAGAEGLHYWAVVHSGFFTLPALRPGTYQVVHSDVWSAHPERVLGAAEVHPGRTTWIDTRNASVEHAGIVLDADGPVHGVRLAFGSHSLAITDSHGRFAFGYGPYLPPSGHLTLSKGPMKWRVLLGAAEVAPLDLITLHLPAQQMEVRTLDREGQPVTARLSVKSDHDAPNWPKAFAVLDTSAAGEARVDHLYAGQYEVEARFRDGCVERANLVLPHAEPVVLRAVPTGDVEVHAVDQHGVPLAYCPVSAGSWKDDGMPPASRRERSQRGTPRYGICGPDGVARFRGVAAGHLDIVVECGERGTTVSSAAKALLQPGEMLRVDVVVQVGERR